MSEYVSLKQLAETLGMDRSHARRFVLRLGYKPVKRRTAESGNQLALAVTAEEAETIVQARKERGFLASEHGAIPNEYGVFYAVQLVPDLDPRRVKLGFASTIEERLSQQSYCRTYCNRPQDMGVPTIMGTGSDGFLDPRFSAYWW